MDIDKQIEKELSKFQLYLATERSASAREPLEKALSLKVKKIITSFKDKPLDLNK